MTGIFLMLEPLAGFSIIASQSSNASEEKYNHSIQPTAPRHNKHTRFNNS